MMMGNHRRATTATVQIKYEKRVSLLHSYFRVFQLSILVLRNRKIILAHMERYV